MFRHLFILALVLAPFVHAGEDYKFTADSEERPNIPHGVVTEYKFNDSKLFPGTARSYWIYLPPNFNKDTAYPFMVFFDGGGAVQPKGGFRAPVVFDNLIADKSIPPLVGIFINPGSVPPIAPGATGRSTRSYEYDTPTDLNARFVIDEIIPLVTQHAKLSDKPEDHAVWGISSGGIAAFTAAWFRPDYFRKVISYIGSYTNIQGGFWYPSAIRKTERKPFRIFLQEGSNDLDNVHGNWPLSNQEMANALKFAGYDYKFTMGDGGHSGKQGGAILPEALRWLWRPAEPLPNPTPEVPNDMALYGILIPGEGWQLVFDGKNTLMGMCTDVNGNLYFSSQTQGILKIAPDGSHSSYNQKATDVYAMQFGADGRLYACLSTVKKLVAFDKDGKVEELANGIETPSIVMNQRGDIFFTEMDRPHRLMLWQRAGKLRTVDAVLDPSKPPFQHLIGLALSPNQETLAAVDSLANGIWTYRVELNGNLSAKLPVMPHRNFETRSSNISGVRGFGIVCDTRARFYCGTNVGIETFDPNGRPIGLILPPTDQAIWSVVLSGTDLGYLSVLTGDGKIYKRKVNAKGFLTSGPPILPEVKKK